MFTVKYTPKRQGKGTSSQDMAVYFYLFSRIDLALLLIFWDFILLGYQVGLGCFPFDSLKHIFISYLNVEQFRTSWSYFDLLMALFSEFKARGVSRGKL